MSAIFSVDLGDSQYRVDNLARSLRTFAGDIRSTRRVLERVRDLAAIPAVESNFAKGGRGQWAPMHEVTPFMPRKNPRGATAPLLNVTGRLKAAATADTRWRIQGADLFVPSDTFSHSMAPYGRMQHEGGTSRLTGGPVPGRPFYYMSQRDVDRAAQVVEQWVWENFNKTVGVKAKAAGRTVGTVMS